MDTVVDYSKVERYRRHGGAYDRGGADSYYRRSRRPHLFVAGSFTSEELCQDDMTPDEIAAYNQGYDDNEQAGVHKEWR